MNSLHHVHLFASDLEKTLAFYVDNFGGKIVYDAEFAGARNIFMEIGKGKIHFYDQPPKHTGRAGIHHIGIQTDDIASVVATLRANGVELRKEVSSFPTFTYIMVTAPDDVLIELFEVNQSTIDSALLEYFG